MKFIMALGGALLLSACATQNRALAGDLLQLGVRLVHRQGGGHLRRADFIQCRGALVGAGGQGQDQAQHRTQLV